MGDGGVNKLDVGTSYADGRTRIKSFKSVSIKRVLPEEEERDEPPRWPPELGAVASAR